MTRNMLPRYTLRLAFHFMNRFSLAHVIDSTTFSKKQFPEPALQSLAAQMLNGLWYAVSPQSPLIPHSHIETF